nr:23S ribosomal RNA methyltransferase Erm [Microcella flavibacter]
MSRRPASSSPRPYTGSPSTPPSSIPRAGHPPSRRHDLGQNDLVDARTIRAVVDAVAATRGPIVELAAGTGRLTTPLADLRRSLTAIELDPRRVDALRSRLPDAVRIVHGDLLTAALPRAPHVVVGNLPFHLTTAALRRLLAAEHWTTAVLIMQWEAARRRAGIGGGSQLTAQWSPWFSFRVDRRIPSTAFRPRPAVDAALLLVDRRRTPIVPSPERVAYQRWVGAVFSVPGSATLALARVDGTPRRAARQRCRRAGIDAERAVSRITAEQWGALWASRPR